MTPVAELRREVGHSPFTNSESNLMQNKHRGDGHEYEGHHGHRLISTVESARSSADVTLFVQISHLHVYCIHVDS